MMKRAEIVALAAALGLLVVGGVLMAGAIYGSYTLGGVANVAFWAGSMGALGQALVAALAWWGIRLARQQAELEEGPALERSSAFKMSFGDDAPSYRSRTDAEAGDVKTLETGFQRVVVALTGVAALALAGVIVWMMSWAFTAYNADPGKGFPIPYGDPLTVVVGVGALAGYLALVYASRVKRTAAGVGEAVSGLVALGLPAMGAVALAGLMSWWRVAYGVEIAAGVWAFVLAVQGLELVVNSTRSYAGIEEFDQVPVDLQATPLTPMLASVWMGGLKMLAGQAVGLGVKGGGERGVIGRMMPRALAALIVLAILVSCIHVVGVGEVAVRERFGRTTGFDDPMHPDLAVIRANLLGPGLHITWPWPIDRLVYIPEARLRMVKVGVEVKAQGPKGMEFHFWTYGQRPEEDSLGQFIAGDWDPKTGSVSPQLLESFAGVWWRVKDPAQFYTAMSHSTYFEVAKEGANEGTRELPIFEAMVQQVAEEAMTQSYAIHSGDQIMTTDRGEVESHTRELMQRRLDEMKSGIEVVQFNIEDVHPPMGNTVDPSGRTAIGPAMAYEGVVMVRQELETMILQAEMGRAAMVAEAEGNKTLAINEAQGYLALRVGTAQGEAEMINAQVGGFTAQPQVARSRVFYEKAAEALPGVPKVILGPGVKPPVILQEGQGGAVFRPPGS